MAMAMRRCRCKCANMTNRSIDSTIMGSIDASITGSKDLAGGVEE